MNNFLNDVKDTIEENSRLLTITSVLLVIFTGITLVDNPEKWWIAALTVVGFAFMFFIFMNARVVIKSILSFVIMTFTAVSAYQTGLVISPGTNYSVTWLLAVVFVFFASISLSYFIRTINSRWLPVTLGYLTSYFSVLLFFVITGETIISLGVIAGLMVFVFAYKTGRKARFSKNKMPQSIEDEETMSKLVKTLSNENWNVRPFHNKTGNRNNILVWNDDYAFILHMIDLQQSFTNIARRKGQKLGYLGKDINSWLINTAFRNTPVWRANGVTMNFVLVDVKSSNGSETKVISGALPDTKGILPIGIVSYRDRVRKKDLSKELIKAFSPFTQKLSARDKAKLNKIGKKVSTEDLVS